MKKFILFLSLAVLPLVSCNNKTYHEHTFQSQWSMDKESHWKEATCEHTDLTKDRGAHVDFNLDFKCDICDYELEAPIHQHTYSDTFSYDIDYHWKESTCEHIGYTSEFGEHIYNGNETCIICGATKAMISISKQPESKNVKLGSSVSFEVSVENADFVKSYQWQILNLELPDELIAFKGIDEKKNNHQLQQEFWIDIDCDSARTNKLVIPGPSFYGEKDYRCVITDVRGNSIATNRCHYTLEDYQQSDPFICVGSYVVVAGQSLDLSNTPFGKGIISLNQDCTQITFNNVDFNNKNPDYDPYDSDVGIYFYCYDFQPSSLNLNLIGNNKIDNHFFQEKSGSAGVSLGFYCSKINQPQISIGGSGSLTIIGGSHCIYSNTPIKVGSNITLKSQQKDRWTSGIHAKSIYINEYAEITANLTAYLLESNDRENPKAGGLSIGEHAIIDATITPCQDASGGSTLSSLSVITSSYNILFSCFSDVSVKVIFDEENLGKGMYLPPVEVVSSNDDGEVTLEPYSKVNIEGIGNNDFESEYILGFNGISSSGNVSLENATYTFNADLKECYTAYGLVGKDVELNLGSKVDINLISYNAYALACKGKFNNIGSSLMIDISGSDPENYVFGLVTYDSLFMNYDSAADIYLHDECKGIAMGVLLGTGLEEKTFDNEYLSQKIDIDSNKFSHQKIRANICSIPSVNGGYQYFEVLYDASIGGEELILNTIHIDIN